MFSRILTAQRCLAAGSDNNTFLAFSRYLLAIVQIPGLISFLLLCALYSIAEYKFTDWYFTPTGNLWEVGFIWKAAFPPSWRFLFLSLFVVPTFSFLHLLWLSFCYMVPAWQRRKYSPLHYQSSHHLLSVLWSPRFIIWLSIFCTSLWLGLHYHQPSDVRYLSLIEKANSHPKREGYANQEKIFIGAMFYNNEQVIPYWSDSIVKTIHYLGADNVFVSVVESESVDKSSELLKQLDDRLHTMRVERRILTQDKVITKPQNMGSNNRIHFLAALRNRVLEPLVENGGYDKVVFTNDIFVEPETIIELLYTADGDYDMACGMDYNNFGLYDMWVLRDKRGRLASNVWPYFFDTEGYEAMHTESPVQVFTCWNGIVAFQADPVLPVHLRSNRTLSHQPLPFALPATHPAANDPSLRGLSPALMPPARFRASAPGECFSSECFLLPYDFRRVFNMQQILVNPRVIVAYEWRFYAYFKWFMRHPVLKWWIEKAYDGAWMHKAVIVVGDPKRLTQWDGGDCHPWQW